MASALDPRSIGLTAGPVNRTLRALEEEGPIRRQRRSIGIPDWHRMRRAADFSERYLHLGRQRAGVGEEGLGRR